MTTATIAPTRPIAIQTATPRERAHTWTITASLCAARAEADGSISLLIADPTGRPHRQLVAFPPAAENCGHGHPILRRRAAAARAQFLDALVAPSFEGYVLLYGTARLTLALPVPRGAATLVPYVTDFALV